ncbi:SDR family oxidoreductase [Acrocarpospora macrocephala]|uniref:Oxidoreductase n=1 Tax=Acrocarpospora macrocephala TaxID=150177 RepID=A0A5M3WMS3_9ACTN|nr:SDR family oxidoreductase [Acrocarpospora macrocephala]GES09459.1 oxidoreductase [Acrocarpospora macrocephala]
MGQRLGGKVALVTGAGSAGAGWGNGMAAAVLFAREGARVFAVDRDERAVERTRAVIEAEGGACTAFVADVSSPAAVAAMVEACVGGFGGLDILHNNVGVASLGGLLDIDEHAWDRALRINITSMFLTCRRAIPHMVEAYRRDGRIRSIVNVGAVAGRRWTGVPMLAYATSKGAVEPFTRSVALQYARDGIRCNCVLPGLMNTPFVMEPLKQAYGDVDRLIEARDEQSPTGEMGTAWDVAHAALYLASDESNFVNAHALVVDGGQSQQTWRPV